MTNFENPEPMMKFTAAQWVLIDAASQYGLDKKLFPERLQFGREILEEMLQLDSVAEASILGDDMRHWIQNAEEPEMFSKALIAISDVMRGEPTGHIIGLDATNSGPQLLSVMCRCVTGMLNTGPINKPDGSLADLYTSALIAMGMTNRYGRKHVKKATVPYVYGSNSEPKAVFQEHAPKFVKAYQASVPWAAWARDKLLSCWNNEGLFHRWELPDGFVSHNVVKRKCTFSNVKYKGVSFSFERKLNLPKVRGVDQGTSSLAANVTHSMDAYIVRELQRRCNYDPKLIERVSGLIEDILDGEPQIGTNLTLERIASNAKRFNMVSLEGIEHIKQGMCENIDHDYLRKLYDLILHVTEHSPFFMRSIHDEYACGANHVNVMKQTYNDILVELYDSTWLFDIIEDLSGFSYHDKLAPAIDVIRDQIRNNDYSIG